MSCKCKPLTLKKKQHGFPSEFSFLQVQEDMLKEGFKTKYEALGDEISLLQNVIKKNQNLNSSLAAQVFDGFGNVLISVLPGAGKLFGLGLKIVSSQMKKPKSSS